MASFKKTWIILCENESILVRCTRDDFHNILIDMYKDKKVIEYFVYRSDEYYMYMEGDNYNVNKNYKNEISREIS